MKTETAIGKKSVPGADSYRVTVTGLSDGNPPLLAFYSHLTLRNGTQRRCGQVVRVQDERLLQRLRAGVKSGDEIRVSTEVDSTIPDCPTFLKDFCPV